MSGYTLNRNQAASHLGVSVKTLSRHMKKNGLPSIKAMGKNGRMEYRFSIEELDKWTYVRQRVEYKGRGQEKTEEMAQALDKTDKRNEETGQGQDKKDIKEEDKTGQVQDKTESVLSLLLSSFQQQISTLEKQLAALQEQLARKDQQIQTLQETSGNLLQLVQVQMNRIEYQPETTRAAAPSQALKKPSPERQAVLQIIRNLQKKGLSHSKIAGELNSQGQPTFSGRGQWQPGTIQKLLKQYG